MTHEMTETTRYLCATVQLDERLCDKIFEEIFEDSCKVTGISYGVDLPTVIKHCIAARRRRLGRNILLGILFLPTILTLPTSPFWFTVFYLINWTVVFLEAWNARYKVVAKHLLRENFNPNATKVILDSSDARRIQEIAESQNANVIIYNRFFPFIGSGLNINNWSFSVNVGKPKIELGKTLALVPFQIDEMHESLAQSITSLNIANLTIEDNFFVSGREIRDDSIFLPDPFKRPNVKLEDSLLKEIIKKSAHKIRHYKCIRITDWSGDLILSVLIRLSRIGQNLFVEANYHLLTPLRPKYRQVDSIKPKPDRKDLLNLVVQSGFAVVPIWLFIVQKAFSVIDFFSIVDLMSTKSKLDKEKDEIKDNPAFNYGASNSLREILMDVRYRYYFQKLDKDMYLKIVERQIIDSIVTFLDSKNIDTSDMKETKAQILNHGVIVSGGSIEAQSISVGERAKSVFNNAIRPDTD